MVLQMCDRWREGSLGLLYFSIPLSDLLFNKKRFQNGHGTWSMLLLFYFISWNVELIAKLLCRTLNTVALCFYSLSIHLMAQSMFFFFFFYNYIFILFHKLVSSATIALFFGWGILCGFTFPGFHAKKPASRQLRQE